MIVFKMAHTPRNIESLGQKSFDRSWPSHQAQLHQNVESDCANPKTLNHFLPSSSIVQASEASGERRRE
jgi:hypothetical protein